MKDVFAALCCCAVLLTGCTAESAEELYARAQAAHQYAQDMVDSLGRGADAKALFAPALEAYEQLVADHPASAQAEQALFKVAEIQAGVFQDVPAAIDSYKRYAVHYAGSAKAPTALFMVGYLYNNYLGNTDSAGTAYRRFLQLYPSHELSTSAQFELENLGRDPQDLLPADPQNTAPQSAQAPAATR